MLTCCHTTSSTRQSGAAVLQFPYPVTAIWRHGAEGEASHQTVLGRKRCLLAGADPMNRLAADLGAALGCPVEVSYLPDTREVLAVARPRTPREVRVSLLVSPIALRVMHNPFAAVKYDLLKQLRRQMGQNPAAS